MKYKEKNSSDFQKVYYDFYLKARWSLMGNEVNREKYFEILHNMDENVELVSVMETFRSQMNIASYEFSIASKLCHTLNPKYPIYDSKVRDFLITKMNLSFWWHQGEHDI